MIVTWRFDLQGDAFKSFYPIFVPMQIVDNIIVWLADYLKGQPA